MSERELRSLKQFWNEVRELIADQFLSWAMSWMPTPRKGQLAAALNPLAKQWAEEAWEQLSESTKQEFRAKGIGR